MDRDELARVIEEAEIAAGCFTVPAVRLAVADAIASWFREYLGRPEVECAAVEACRDDPFCDDLHLLGTTQQDLRMTHYARAALAGAERNG